MNLGSHWAVAASMASVISTTSSVGQRTGHRIQEHGLEHLGPVALERRFHREFLGRHDALQLAAQDPRDGGHVPRPHALGSRRPDALHDDPLGQVSHLPGVREIDREVAVLAAQEPLEEGGDQLPHGSPGISSAASSALTLAMSARLSAW